MPVQGVRRTQMLESLRVGDYCEVYLNGRWVPATVRALLELERGASRVTLDFGSEGLRQLTLPGATVYDNELLRLVLHAGPRSFYL